MNNLNPREATKGMTLFYNRKGSRDDSLTSNNCCKSRDNKNWPIHSICKRNIASRTQNEFLFILQILGHIMNGIRSTTNQVLNRRNYLELMIYFLTEKQPDPCIVLRDKGIQHMQMQSAQTQNIRTNTSNR